MGNRMSTFELFHQMYDKKEAPPNSILKLALYHPTKYAWSTAGTLGTHDFRLTFTELNSVSVTALSLQYMLQHWSQQMLAQNRSLSVTFREMLLSEQGWHSLKNWWPQTNLLTIIFSSLKLYTAIVEEQVHLQWSAYKLIQLIISKNELTGVAKSMQFLMLEVLKH